MIWALLAVIGVVVASVLIVGIGLLVSRRRTARRGDTFACRVRLIAGSVNGLENSWTHSVRYGTWVHDVLVLRYGPGLTRTQLLPVGSAEGSLRPRTLGVPARLGSGGVVGLGFTLDDGAVVDVTAAADDGDLLLGPFLLAGVAGFETDARSRRGGHRE